MAITSRTDAGGEWCNRRYRRPPDRIGLVRDSLLIDPSCASLAPFPLVMFDHLFDAMRSLTDRSAPDERRRVAHAMKDALVHAKLGLQDLRTAIAVTERRVAQERTELQTVERRLGLAAQIQDAETVAIAEKYRGQHAERLAVLETKLMSQQQELTLGERELEDMTAQMRRAMSGLPIDSGGNAERQAEREVEAALNGDGTFSSQAFSEELEAPRLSRAEKEAAAEDRLAELKRRMGK